MMQTAIYPWQRMLWQQVRQNSARPHHALLLTGRAGIGKFAWARSLAKAMLCEQVNADAAACGICTSCCWFEQNQHPNFRLLTAEALSEAVDHADKGKTSGVQEGGGDARSKKKPSQQITIAQIRELDDFVYLSAHQNRDRLVLIHPAEAMNHAAANALLKKLEEPPPHVVFILVAHDASSLLATIRSRCQQIPMPLPDRQVAQDWLRQQKVDHVEVRLAMSGFAPLLALQFDEPWFVRYQIFIRRLSVLKSLDVVGVAEEMQQFELLCIVDWLQKWCFDLMSCRATGKVRYYLQEEAVIREIAAKIDPEVLAFLWRDLITSRRWARHPLNPRLFIESLLYRYLDSIA
ncbi:MAG: DNA polymerase III subunit delta' [Nitrosomonas sp.]|jgi:DNA polymerase-3 subunit delta'|nr:DNA polymerase III subunit delta' [Nitrosomonas sp.]MCC7136008.1 DNA polymerase III subunit delta' [Nitrosomonas sp.]